MRAFIQALLCLVLASCGFSPEAAFAQPQQNYGGPAYAGAASQPVGAAPIVPNAQGGLTSAQPVVPAAPPTVQNVCNYMGSPQCPQSVSEAVFPYTHISTSTTTTIYTTAGHFLHTVCVNKAGSAGSVTVDDAATATTPTLAVLDSTVALCHTYDAILTTGLVIVTTGAPDVTVTAR